MARILSPGIQVKLLIGFAAVIVLMAISILFSLQALNSSVADSDSLYNDQFQGSTKLDSARQDAQYATISTMYALLAKDFGSIGNSVTLAQTHLESAKTKLVEFRASVTHPQLIAQIDSAIAEMDKLRDVRAEVLDSARKGDIIGARDLNENGSDGQVSAQMQSEVVLAHLDTITQSQLTIGQAVFESSKDAAARARLISVGIAIVAALLGLTGGYLIARQVKKSVHAVVSGLEALEAEGITEIRTGISAFAEGDLTVEVAPTCARIEKHSKDELGRASRAVNNIIDSVASTIEQYNEARVGLASLVGGVRDNAGAILVASDSLREASDQMAAATGQIATSINEVTRSALTLSELSQDSAQEIERVAVGAQQLAAASDGNAEEAVRSRDDATQMGERIGLVANASQEVATAAEDSRNAAMEGQQAVEMAVTSMESIARAVEHASATVNQLGEYGQQIGDIVKTIDDIAGQTNLLALNAAIEAARAGEQGRGFAVVAENVRSLAERASSSTKEISALIGKVQSGTQEAVKAMAAGVQDVERGREITFAAGRSLESIIASVQQSAVQMQRIAAEVQDLAAGTQRIVTSAESIAVSASQSAEAAGEMAQGTAKVTDAIIQVSATSEETSASAEQVSASTEELSAQSEELAATATQMRELAESLNNAAARFRLLAEQDAGQLEEPLSLVRHLRGQRAAGGLPGPDLHDDFPDAIPA